MRILLSNDDGFNAPGINILNDVLSSYGHDTIIVAPEGERSTTGHTLSLDKPLRVEKVSENKYACTGFPADCSLIGLGHILKDNPPELVVSGINRGANLAQDLYYSGTVAAAREASFQGFPSIAVSLDFKKENASNLHFETAAKVIQKLLEKKIHKFIPELGLLNVNVPNVTIEELKGIKLARMGRRHYSGDIHERVDARGRDYYWVGGILSGHEKTQDKLSDCEVVEAKFASVTPYSSIIGKECDFETVKGIIEELKI